MVAVKGVVNVVFVVAVGVDFVVPFVVFRVEVVVLVVLNVVVVFGFSVVTDFLVVDGFSVDSVCNLMTMFPRQHSTKFNYFKKYILSNSGSYLNFIL